MLAGATAAAYLTTWLPNWDAFGAATAARREYRSATASATTRLAIVCTGSAALVWGVYIHLEEGNIAPQPKVGVARTPALNISDGDL